jgi:molybdopterin synthase sulfur carrier subunit
MNGGENLPSPAAGFEVRVRYFASLREALGAHEPVRIAPGTTVAALRAALAARGGPHAAVLAAGRPVRAAVGGTICDEATVIAPGAEVAFFPPVTGG